jgi:hypothetical protein
VDEYGREREQAGDAAAAEQALHRAVELARVIRFRAGSSEIFICGRIAATKRFGNFPKLRRPARAFGEQFTRLRGSISTATRRASNDCRTSAGSAGESGKIFAGKGRAEDCLRVWNTLTDDQKAASNVGTRDIAQALFDKGFYRSAVEFIRQLNIEPDARAEIVQNGGFEKPIGETKTHISAGKSRRLANWKSKPTRLRK